MLSSSVLILSVLILSACTDAFYARGQNSPASPSNAQRAANLANAVEFCVGRGLEVGTPRYEACVKSRLR